MGALWEEHREEREERIREGVEGSTTPERRGEDTTRGEERRGGDMHFGFFFLNETKHIQFCHFPFLCLLLLLTPFFFSTTSITPLDSDQLRKAATASVFVLCR